VVRNELIVMDKLINASADTAAAYSSYLSR